ncbi:hypothetical protein O3G_MSEX009320 [Manduca sexta]|uniref:Uncharacterized protein n=1 Tax=Manduca sexta TaxID=7130 RepID=A0A922CRL1_MANSE|nr:hypothetical protein O3G_MSEX009320 [Manduca sexta]
MLCPSTKQQCASAVVFQFNLICYSQRTIDLRVALAVPYSTSGLINSVLLLSMIRCGACHQDFVRLTFSSVQLHKNVECLYLIVPNRAVTESAPAPHGSKAIDQQTFYILVIKLTTPVGSVAYRLMSGGVES